MNIGRGRIPSTHTGSFFTTRRTVLVRSGIMDSWQRGHEDPGSTARVMGALYSTDGRTRRKPLSHQKLRRRVTPSHAADWRHAYDFVGMGWWAWDRPQNLASGTKPCHPDRADQATRSYGSAIQPSLPACVGSRPFS